MVKTITKWAFGMAPYKKETYKQILFSIDILEESLNNKSVDFNRMLESISRIKGLYNRIIRQDQWDWMTTAAYFDFPTTYECRHIVSFLSHLKSGINSSDEHLILQAKDRLCKSTVRCHFQNFRTYNPAVGRNGQYIYILSRREDRDVLKIGMTTRDVVVRAREINSATASYILLVFAKSSKYMMLIALKKQYIKHLQNTVSEMIESFSKSVSRMPVEKLKSL